MTSDSHTHQSIFLVPDASSSSTFSSPPAPPRRPVTPAPSPQSGIVVFSGGSAANNLVDVFEDVRQANQCALSYVIPISDNGGSTSEIIRVFGGPGKASSLPSFSLAKCPHFPWREKQELRGEPVRDR